MIKLNKHGLISKRLIAPEFTVGNTFVEGGGTPEELAVLSLTNEQLAALSYIVNGEGRIIPVGEDGTFDTKIGHSYCIRHTDDLILHEAWLSNDENLYVKRYGSGQLLFFATSEKCKINDPSYIVTEVFRMAALNDFVDWSGIEHYQKWFKEIEVELTELLGSRNKFVLEIVDENTLVVHTDRVSDELSDATTALLERVLPQNIEVAQYNHHIKLSWRVADKYANCTTVNAIKAVNAAYQSDLTSDMEWLYPLPLLEDGSQMFDKAAQIVGWDSALPALTNGEYMFRSSSLVNFKSKLPKLTNVNGMFAMSKITKWDIALPALTNGQLMFYNTPLVYFRGGLPEMTSGTNMFWLAKLKEFHGELPKLSWGEAMFRECPLNCFESSLPKLSNGSNMFSNSRLNKVSALNVLNSIPSYTSGSHPLTIGIHVYHKSDDEVLAAIANAEAKGWTLTVQWNGTSTSTASTMAMGTLIYAKVGEIELPDGTTERVLDWGHYVTNPEGYETFRSLESAYEYFGLEMPEIE